VKDTPQSSDYALAELAGYSINTVDIYGVVWVYPKKGGDTFRYLPATDLRLLAECARGINTLRNLDYNYYVYGGEKHVRCTISAGMGEGSQLFICTRPTDEEALYAALQAYLESRH